MLLFYEGKRYIWRNGKLTVDLGYFYTIEINNPHENGLFDVVVENDMILIESVFDSHLTVVEPPTDGKIRTDNLKISHCPCCKTVFVTAEYLDFHENVSGEERGKRQRNEQRVRKRLEEVKAETNELEPMIFRKGAAVLSTKNCYKKMEVIMSYDLELEKTAADIGLFTASIDEKDKSKIRVKLRNGEHLAYIEIRKSVVIDVSSIHVIHNWEKKCFTVAAICIRSP
ncbi:unnamed protein product [Caenorhabditis brenneri]